MSVCSGRIPVRLLFFLLMAGGGMPLISHSQDTLRIKRDVETLNAFLALQVGLPTLAMQPAIKNEMGDFGIGAGIMVLTNPFSWGRNPRNSPLRLGGEIGYTYYGRFLSKVNINGYRGDYKTSYGVLQLNALVQIRTLQQQMFSPFVEILGGGNFYLSHTKENLTAIESALGIEGFDIDNHVSVGFNKGVAFGMAIGRNTAAPRFTLRVSYNEGSHIRYVVRNSLVYDATDNRLEYELGRAPVRYFMVQVGIGM